ncbi:MAG TPA: MFS transporter [Blastocatellia bacterium]|nr:MFS transporter [Blastocatellia bacterium]
MPDRGKTFYGWWVVGSAFAFMFLIVGFATYGLPLFYNLWVGEFGWKRADIQFGNTMGKLIVGPIFGFLAGWVIDRYGPRRVMLLGALSAAGALLGFGWMGSIPVLYLFFFFNAVGYLCAGPLPNQVLLSHWFTRLRGRVMGIAYVGIGVGGMIVPWVIYFLNKQFGWRGSLRLLGLLFAVVMLLMLLVVKRRPADLGLFPDGDAEPSDAAAAKPLPVRLASVMRTPAFWLLAAGSVLSIGAIGGVIQNLALYIADIRPKAEVEITKATISSITLMSSVAGRLTMGWLADRFTKKYVMLVTYCLVGLSIPLLILARDYPPLLYVFAVAFGFGLGADYMLIPLMAAECFGLAALSRVLGIIIMSDAVGEALMPYLVAYFRDKNGSYVGGFTLATALAMLGAVAILSIRYRNGVPVSRLQLQSSEAS